MGSKSNRSWKFILVMLSICFSRFAKAATMKYNGRDSASLDDFLQNYASEKFPTPRTGVQYVVSLPANFTGMGASFVRVRAKSFWERRFNSNSFHIPLGMPFAKKFDGFAEGFVWKRRVCRGEGFVWRVYLMRAQLQNQVCLFQIQELRGMIGSVQS